MQIGDRVQVVAPERKGHGATGVVAVKGDWLGEPDSYGVQFDEVLKLEDASGLPDIYSGGLYREHELRLVQPATPSAVS